MACPAHVRTLVARGCMGCPPGRPARMDQVRGRQRRPVPGAAPRASAAGPRPASARHLPPPLPYAAPICPATSAAPYPPRHLCRRRGGSPGRGRSGRLGTSSGTGLCWHQLRRAGRAGRTRRRPGNNRHRMAAAMGCCRSRRPPSRPVPAGGCFRPHPERQSMHQMPLPAPANGAFRRTGRMPGRHASRRAAAPSAARWAISHTTQAVRKKASQEIARRPIVRPAHEK